MSGALPFYENPLRWAACRADVEAALNRYNSLNLYRSTYPNTIILHLQISTVRWDVVNECAGSVYGSNVF